MKLKYILFSIGLASLVSVTSLAQSAGLSAYSTTATYTFGTTNFVVGSISSISGHTPTVRYLNASTDTAGKSVQFWTPYPGLAAASNATTSLYMVQNVGGTGGTNAVYATNNIAPGNPIVIRHKTNETYEVRSVAAVSGFTVTLNAAPTTGITAGDMIYPYTATGASTIPVIPNTTWAVTNLVVGPAAYVFVGVQDCPILASITFTAASGGAINCMTGDYLP